MWQKEASEKLYFGFCGCAKLQSLLVLGPIHTGRVSRFARKSFDVACNAV